MRTPILMVAGLLVGFAALGLIALQLSGPEENDAATATVPISEEGGYYSADLEGAREHWEAGDRPITTVAEHDEIHRFAIWKTSDSRSIDDGGPSLAPALRTQVVAGTELMVLAGPIDTRIKVTNGDWVGWIGEVQLDSLPRSP